MPKGRPGGESFSGGGGVASRGARGADPSDINRFKKPKRKGPRNLRHRVLSRFGLADLFSRVKRPRKGSQIIRSPSKEGFRKSKLV
jgi:hypothetical protein